MLIKPVYAASETINFPLNSFSSAGDFVNSLVLPAFAIGGILLTFYLIIGAFKWMTSGGEKQALADAREMMTHAIIGFFGLVLLFLIVKFIQETFGLAMKIIR